MANFKIVDNHVELTTLPKSNKKLTATRFATILGLNEYATPFEAWCAITKTWEKPFEDSIYTIAGKIIEPKICDYLRNHYFMDIKSPTDVYGADYFKKTCGDFFPDEDVFGGMWDFKGDDFVVEVKTTKNVDKWKGKDGKVEPPIYYKLQACLYAYLLGFEDVIMTCSFLTPNDYEDPDAFVPTLDNTVEIEFNLHEAFPTFEETYINPALEFWNKHVLTGISPDFDEKKDADILKELRKNTVDLSSDKDLTKMLNEADRLRSQISKAELKLKPKKERLKTIEDAVKVVLKDRFRETDKQVEVTGKSYNWSLTKSVKETVDKKAVKELPDSDKYFKLSTTYTLRTTEIKKDEK